MKRVYSLMLDDGVVAAVDRLAYREGRTRSGMIESILAEYVSYVRPEERIRRAFSEITDLLGRGGMLPVAPPSDTLLSLRSALVYKYNPTVRYSVQLYRTQEEGVGELRVSLRTQNRLLTDLMMRFFALWSELEARHIGAVHAAFEDGKYVRLLTPRDKSGARLEETDATELGESIAAYIRAFDGALKIFFRYADDGAAALREMEESYIAYLSAAEMIL